MQPRKTTPFVEKNKKQWLVDTLVPPKAQALRAKTHEWLPLNAGYLCLGFSKTGLSHYLRGRNQVYVTLKHLSSTCQEGFLRH